MSPDTHDARIDRVADRLAGVLGEALASLARLRGDEMLTDDEAARELSALLDAQGIQLADGLVEALACGCHDR